MNNTAQSPFRREVADFLQLLNTLPGVLFVEDAEPAPLGPFGADPA